MARQPVKGIVVPITGPSREVELSDFRDYQKCVGGLIEPVKLKDAAIMYVNEEGLINGMEVNYFASDVAGLGGATEFLMYGVRGDVVIVGPLDDEGYSTDVTDKARDWIERVERER